MSAYGSIAIPNRPEGASLIPRVYNTSQPNVKLAVCPARKEDLPDDLTAFLALSFNEIVAEGKTYPQEQALTAGEFAGYFLATDFVVGLLLQEDGELPIQGQERSDLTLESCRGSHSWTDVVAGAYYIKPNYPGRSSHNCNAGFIVFPKHRGLKVGLALGRSYLHYGPRLGYRASVFNLVYANNKASLAIWDRLGFTRAGLIPEAGRLKSGPEGQEELVDAVVIYKRFDDIKE